MSTCACQLCTPAPVRFTTGLVKREDLFVTSKLWNKEHGEVEAALKRVLKDLQLEYLDLYLVHWCVAPAATWLQGCMTSRLCVFQNHLSL